MSDGRERGREARKQLIKTELVKLQLEEPN